MWTGFGCIIFGCLLIHAWWFETYTDSALASAWRRMSAAWSPTRSAQAILRHDLASGESVYVSSHHA